MKVEVISHCYICGSQELTQLDPVANLIKCNHCEYVFVSPRPTVQSLIEYYSQPQKYDGWLNEEKERDALWKRRLKIMNRTKKGGSLLDVGTGTGQFLHHARHYYSKVYGTEVSESAIRIAKDKYGLDVLKGELEDMPLDEKFDNISLFHILEHAPNPKRLLEKCKQLLNSKGIVVIAVPNDLFSWDLKIKTYLKKLRKTLPSSVGAFGIPHIVLDGSQEEIHLSQFAPKSLRFLMESLGFKVLVNSLDPFYAKKGKKLLIHNMYYFFHKTLKTLLGINRYNTILFVCQKCD